MNEIDVASLDVEKGLSTEKSDASAPFVTAIAPRRGWVTIRPWLTPRPYPFLPRALGWAMVLSVPLILPAVLIVLGTFSVEKARSTMRVRKHLQAKEKSNAARAREQKSSPLLHVEATKSDAETQRDVDDSATLARTPTSVILLE